MGNANIAFEQGADYLRTGGRIDQDSLHWWNDVQFVLLGGFPTERVSYADDFLGDLIADEWAADISTGATVAINSQAGGAVRLTTDTDDDDHATLALSLSWTPGNGEIVFSARVKSVTATTVRAIEIGVSDALSETNGLAFSDHATPTAVANDAVIFGFDTDASMTTWAANSVKAAGTPQVTLTTGLAPSTTYQKLTIRISALGAARFYINNVLVATHANAVATTALLTPWFSLKSLSGAAKSIDADYIQIMGTR